MCVCGGGGIIFTSEYKFMLAVGLFPICIRALCLDIFNHFSTQFIFKNLTAAAPFYKTTTPWSFENDNALNAFAFTTTARVQENASKSNSERVFAIVNPLRVAL